MLLFITQSYGKTAYSINGLDKDPPCVAQCKVKLEKLNSDLADFEHNLEIEFRNSVYLNNVRRFRMYSNGYKNHLNACTQDNPKIDMSEIAAGYETFKKRLEKYNDALEAKESWAAEMEKIEYAISKLTDYFVQMPTSHLTHIDISAENTVTAAQWKMFQDYKENTGAFYNNVILDTKNEIKRVEERINQESTKNNFESTINNIANRTDQADAKAELTKVLSDLNYFKSIFYPENQQLDLFIQMVKAKI